MSARKSSSPVLVVSNEQWELIRVLPKTPQTGVLS